jgi:hypothetical protein
MLRHKTDVMGAFWNDLTATREQFGKEAVPRLFGTPVYYGCEQGSHASVFVLAAKYSPIKLL